MKENLVLALEIVQELEGLLNEKCGIKELEDFMPNVLYGSGILLVRVGNVIIWHSDKDLEEDLTLKYCKDGFSSMLGLLEGMR